MFYSQYILSKKGPLGTIWIAAHLDRKLRKTQIAETNIGKSIDSILFPEAPIALRLSGHLLLGVVRIYSKKVNYLFQDCSEALIKIKQSFHSAIVDLPPERATAPYHSITLPDTFDLDEVELLPDFENSFLSASGSFVDHHVTTREQITLQDPTEGIVYMDSQIGPDERFADGDTSQIGLHFDEDMFAENVQSAEGNPSSIPVYEVMPLPICGNRDNSFQIEAEVCNELLSPLFGAEKDFTTVERDTSTFAALLYPVERPARKAAQMDASSSENVKCSITSLVEARTPDLNQEFCPPAEPSTPALPDENSTATFRETFSPGFAEGFGQQIFTIESVENSSLAVLHQGSLIEFPPQVSEGSLPISLSAGVSATNSQQQFVSPNFLSSDDAVRLTSQETSTRGSLQELDIAAAQPRPSTCEASQKFSDGPSHGFIASSSATVSASHRVFPLGPVQLSSKDFEFFTSPTVMDKAVSSMKPCAEKPLGPVQLSSKDFEFFTRPTVMDKAVSSMKPCAEIYNHSIVAAPFLQPFDANMPNMSHTCVISSTSFCSFAASEQIPLALKQPQIDSVVVNEQAAGTMSIHDVYSVSQKSTLPFSMSLKKHSSSEQNLSHTDIHMLSLPNQGQSGITDSNNNSDYNPSHVLTFSVATEDLGSLQLPLVPLPSHSTVKDGYEIHAIHVPEFETSMRLSNDRNGYTALEHENIPINGMDSVQDKAEEIQHACWPLASSSMGGDIPSSVDRMTHGQGSVVKLPECEKLRTAWDSQSKPLNSSAFISSLMNKTPSSEKLGAHVYEGRNTRENGRLYTTEKSPSLRDNTPYGPLSPLPFSNKNVETLPGDDVLATILLGIHASPFKVVPMLQRNPISKRSSTRPGTYLATKKQKILDTSTMLHGDVITEQHENTEDIRRLRKKAPCTRHEVWALEIESRGQQCLFEPTHPELPIELHELYYRVYGSNGSVLSFADTAVVTSCNQLVIEPRFAKGDTELEHAMPGKHQEDSLSTPVIEPNMGTEHTMAGCQQDDIISRPWSEPHEAVHEWPLRNAPVMNETTVGRKMTLHAEVLKRKKMKITNVGDVEQTSNSFPIISMLKGDCATSEMGILDGKNDECEKENQESFDISQPESLDINVLQYEQSLEHEMLGQEAIKTIADNMPTASVGYNVLEFLREIQPARVESNQEIPWDVLERSLADLSQIGVQQEGERLKGEVDKMRKYGAQSMSLCNNEVLGFKESKEQQLSIKQKEDCSIQISLMCNKLESLRGSQSAEMEGNQIISVLSTKSFVHGMTQMKEKQLEIEPLAEIGDSVQDELPQECTDGEMHIEGEDQTISHEVMRGKSGLDIVGPWKENLNGQQTQNITGIPLGKDTNCQVLGFNVDRKDPDFLAVDDDDEAAYQEGYVDAGDKQDIMLFENSGWSMRTRNVARYLRNVFEGLEGYQRESQKQEDMKLAVGRLLIGRKRKEVARMFFETLVLKSKDYLHVEQAVPFGDICLYPRPQLLKANFLH